MTDPRLDESRRSLIRKGAVGAGVAWVAPQVLSAPMAGAQVTYELQIDPSNCTAVVTTVPSVVGGCAPAGWVASDPVPPVAFTILENNGLDCLNGMALTLTTAGFTISEPQAEETCPTDSPPTTACVAGVLSVGDTVVTWPDNSGGAGSCVYAGFRMMLNGASVP